MQETRETRLSYYDWFIPRAHVGGNIRKVGKKDLKKMDLG